MVWQHLPILAGLHRLIYHPGERVQQSEESHVSGETELAGARPGKEEVKGNLRQTEGDEPGPRAQVEDEEVLAAGMQSTARSEHRGGAKNILAPRSAGDDPWVQATRSSPGWAAYDRFKTISSIRSATSSARSVAVSIVS